MTVNTAREEILGNVRRALRRNGRTETLSTEAEATASPKFEDLVPQIRKNCELQRETLIERFEAESKRIGVRFQRANGWEFAHQYIADVGSERDAKRIVAWEAQVFSEAGLQGRLEKHGVEFITETAGPEFIRKAEAADIGISGVDYALADTGTLVLLAGKGQARSISLLPPVHIAIVRPDQILSGLSDLFPLLRAEAKASFRDLSSAITLITGPSRTADIELTLVVGVHGPQQLHVLLLD